MAKTNKFNVPNGLMNQGKVADIHTSFHSLSFIRIQQNFIWTGCFFVLYLTENIPTYLVFVDNNEH